MTKAGYSLILMKKGVEVLTMKTAESRLPLPRSNTGAASNF
jgi:hypothetical protein